MSTNPKRKSVSAPAELMPAAALDKINISPFTDQDICNLLEGCIYVHPQLWDYIPPGAYIRFFEKGDKSRTERFRPGGFVRSHYISNDKKMMTVESHIGGKKDDAGYFSFPLAYENIDELWKKYDRDAFVEIHLIYNSLAQKKKQIDMLMKQNHDLFTRLSAMESALARLKK